MTLISRDPSLNWLELDGSVGEGGGAILRVFAGIACFLRRPLYIYNIRKNRDNPGLRTQHLLGIQSLVQLTNGSSSPLTIGTTELTFQPGTAEWNSKCAVYIPTAGNIGMLAQTLYNALYNPPTSSGEFVIHVTGGGTYGTHAPGPEYLNHVTYPLLQLMGYKVDLRILRQGYYPKGGAEAEIHIQPAESLDNYRGLWLEERGDLISIAGRIHVTNTLENAHVAERIAQSIRSYLTKSTHYNVEIDLDFHYHQSLSVGVGVDLWANFSSGVVLGAGTVLGQRGVSSEKVGEIAATKLHALLQSEATVDEYASDQVIPFIFIVNKSSRFIVPSISSHFHTNLMILEQIFQRSCTITSLSRGFMINY